MASVSKGTERSPPKDVRQCVREALEDKLVRGHGLRWAVCSFGRAEAVTHFRGGLAVLPDAPFSVTCRPVG